MRNAYKHFIKYALNKGCNISVFDGEEWQVKRSTKQKDIIDAVESIEEAELRVRDSEGNKIAWASVIPFGVEPDETIADYSANEFMQEWNDIFDSVKK